MNRLPKSRKIVVAIGGASGSIYAKTLLDSLVDLNLSAEHNIAVVMSDNARINWELENGAFKEADYTFPIYANNDFMAPFASGSAGFDSMVIIPCSMGLVGRIASGVSDDLISRSADVILKERRRLICVVRETPYNLIHLRNMTTITEAGGIICPATPSFYFKPETAHDVVMTVINRVFDLLDIEHKQDRWGSK